jgi:hypothetical protein
MYRENRKNVAKWDFGRYNRKITIREMRQWIPDTEFMRAMSLTFLSAIPIWTVTG